MPILGKILLVVASSSPENQLQPTHFLTFLYLQIYHTISTRLINISNKVSIPAESMRTLFFNYPIIINSIKIF